MAKTGRPRSKVLLSDEELRSLYHDDGMSASQIGKLCDVDASVILYHMKMRGIPRRAPSACPGKMNGSWKGGRILDKHGYVLIHVPDHPDANSGGYVREHRLVMERVLGRRLHPKEVVHHKDGNRENNSEGNLELYQQNGEHLRKELAGRAPRWTEDGIRRIRESMKNRPQPEWSEDRREAARMRLHARWSAPGGVPRRGEWTDEEKEAKRQESLRRTRRPDGTFE